MDWIALLLIVAATVAAPAEGDRPCAADTTEIVVCGRAVSPDHYRLPPLAAPPERGPPRAEWGLGGGVRAGITLQPKSLQQGVVSNRLMATVKIPF